MSYRKEPGDWICGSCGKSNFKKRQQCFGCKRSRYTTSDQHRYEQKGPYNDWWCPTCNFKIFGSKSHCSKCNTKRKDEDNYRIPEKGSSNFTSTTQPREGDWTCPRCTENQFARNKFCRSCGTPNPSNSNNNNNEDLEDGNECVICMDKPKNATLIHGDCGHTVCCLECAKSLYANRGSCPMCRRPIEKVIQNFI